MRWLDGWTTNGDKGAEDLKQVQAARERLLHSSSGGNPTNQEAHGRHKSNQRHEPGCNAPRARRTDR
jgi:hypothetical protein